MFIWKYYHGILIGRCCLHHSKLFSPHWRISAVIEYSQIWLRFWRLPKASGTETVLAAVRHAPLNNTAPGGFVHDHRIDFVFSAIAINLMLNEELLISSGRRLNTRS